MSHDWAKEAGMEFADEENDPNTEAEPIGDLVDVEKGEVVDFKEPAEPLKTEVLGKHPSGDGPLSKRSVLMNLEDYPKDEDEVAFSHVDEDGEVTDLYSMTHAAWIDFGRPETITVVVYPRDMLN